AHPHARRSDHLPVPAFARPPGRDRHRSHDRAQSHALRTSARHGRLPHDIERRCDVAGGLETPLRTCLADRPGSKDKVRPEERVDAGSWDVSQLKIEKSCQPGLADRYTDSHSNLVCSYLMTNWSGAAYPTFASSLVGVSSAAFIRMNSPITSR